MRWTAIAPLFLLTACEPAPETVTELVSEPLPVVAAPQAADHETRLLGGGVAISYTFRRPAVWREVPPRADFYLKSYEIPGGGRCDVAVTGGGLESNLQRWFGQIAEAEWPGSAEDLPTIELAGRKGRLVELFGRYEPGMGRPAQPDAGLLGAAAGDATGSVLTIKITGPAELVEAERVNFLTFCSSLAESGADPH